MKGITTFWSFLSDPNINSIVIPMLQRNYVQGVLTRDGIQARKIVDAVLSATIDEKLSLNLDFIYGALEESKVFYPLDGQQRLTLLWLLHWYISLRCGTLKEDSKILKKFTYSTRESTRRFMSHLLEEFDISQDTPLHIQIQRRCWFYSGWLYDISISSMLNILPIFEDKLKQRGDMSAIQERLHGKLAHNGIPCNICFYVLDLNAYNQSDDLFIKMNARGKKLESLENFKADLIGYNMKRLCKDAYDIWKNDFIQKFDGIWIDHFWKHSGVSLDDETTSADTLFYRFICRIFIDRLMLSSEEKKDIWKNHVLMSREEDGKYNSLQPFLMEDINKGHDLTEVLKDIKDIMSHLVCVQSSHEVINEIARPTWSNTDETHVHYIPTIKEKVCKLADTQRPIFHAVVAYIRRIEQWDSDDVFRRWMSFVWNIKENCPSSESEVRIMKLYEDAANAILPADSVDTFNQKLSEWRPRIFADKREVWTQLQFQVEEEIEKAKIRTKSSDSSGFIKILNEAEEEFRGFTRLLYHQENWKKQPQAINQEEFKARWNGWEKWMDEKSDYERSHSLLCHIQDSKLEKNKIFFPSKESPEKKRKYWIDYFRDLEGNKFDFLRELLDSEGKQKEGDKKRENGEEQIGRYRKILLADKALVEYLINTGWNEGYELRFDIKGMKVRYGQYRNNVLLDIHAELRGEIISIWGRESTFMKTPTHAINDSKFLMGRDICFQYNGKEYQWDNDGKIHKKDCIPVEKSSCIDVNIDNQESIINILNNIDKLIDAQYVQIEVENFHSKYEN